jgi:hypothetical protein
MLGLRSIWYKCTALCLVTILLVYTLFEPAPATRNNFFHHRVFGNEIGQPDELVEITTERSDVKTIAHPNTPIVVDDLNFDDDEFKVRTIRISLKGTGLRISDMPSTAQTGWANVHAYLNGQLVTGHVHVVHTRIAPHSRTSLPPPPPQWHAPRHTRRANHDSGANQTDGSPHNHHRASPAAGRKAGNPGISGFFGRRPEIPAPRRLAHGPPPTSPPRGAARRGAARRGRCARGRRRG